MPRGMNLAVGGIVSFNFRDGLLHQHSAKGNITLEWYSKPPVLLRQSPEKQKMPKKPKATM